MDLFIQPNVQFEKVAAEVDLPEDPNAWPKEVLDELFKQVPYISDFQPHVVMQRVDGERGYGFGHVEISNQTDAQIGSDPQQVAASGVRSVRVPVIIKDGKLSPFDLLVNDTSKVLPLTEPRLRQAIFRPQAFDITGRGPGDQSLVGQLYPPYRQNLGFAGGGMVVPADNMGKMSAAKPGKKKGYDVFAGIERQLELDEQRENAGRQKKASSFEEFLIADLEEHDGGFREVKTAGILDRAGRAVSSAVSGVTAPVARETASQAVEGAVDAALPKVRDAGRLAAEGAAEGLEQKGKEFLSQNKGKIIGGAVGGAGLLGAGGVVHHGLERHRHKQLANDLAAAVKGGVKTAGVIDRAGEAISSTARKGAQKFLDKKGRKLMYEGLRKNSPARSRLGVAARQMAVQLEKKGSVLQAVLPTIGPAALDQFWGQLEKDAGLRAAFTKNKYACRAPLRMLSDHEPLSAEKIASAIPVYVHPTVVQVSRANGGYMIKSASHYYWRPSEEIVDRGELLERFGEKVAFSVDRTGSVTISDDATAKEVEKVAAYAPVFQPGVYKVRDDEGKELVGYVVPNLVDLDGDVLPIALFTNGSQATIQAEILGEPVADAVNLPEGPIGGQGFFYSINEDGQIQATIPMTLQGSHQMGGEPSTFTGETYDGRPAEVSVQPNIQQPTPMEEGKLLLPDQWRWCSLAGAQQVGLAGGEADAQAGAAEGGSAEGGGGPGPQGPQVPETAEVPTDDSVKESSAYVWARASGDSFSLSGPALEKVAGTSFVNFDQAMFILAGLGVDLGYGATKLAHAMSGDRPEPIRIGRYITLAEEQEKEASMRAAVKLASFPCLRVNLVKEAALIPDPTAVDTVLSLGFINPENLMTFVSYLPAIDDAQTKMCELLLAARLGLQDVPASALERAIRSTEEAIEGLKILAFQST